MDQSIVLSIFNFMVGFGFLAAVVIGLRALFGRDGRSRRSQAQSIAPDGMEHEGPEWSARKVQDYLAPPPVPRDDLDHHHAADYVLDRTSPYPIPQPQRRDEGEW